MGTEVAAKKQGQTLDQAGPQTVASAKIEFHTGPILLPYNEDGHPMSLDDAVKIIKARQEFLEGRTDFIEVYDVELLDGAHALGKVLEAKYGWLPQGSGATLISTEIAFGVNVNVPWGEFKLPGVEDGKMKCSFTRKSNRWVFQIVANVKRKDEPTIRQIFGLVREYLKEASIYRGKAFKVNFSGSDGEAPEIQFMDLSSVIEDKVIFSQSVYDEIYDNLITPLRRIKELRANGIKVKRGIGLAGTYGVGKSLVMMLAARVAQDEGITCIYISKAAQLPRAIEFAKKYQIPACLIECEDIDRETSGERSEEMDQILNMIDGIDTKSSNIIVVLTTNDLDAINPAMLRPGRLDAVIPVTPPDAHAAGRLVKAYGGDLIGADVDLDAVGTLLAGHIPAIIEEVVQRAKLSQLRRNAVGKPLTHLSQGALEAAATSMGGQIKMLNDRINTKKPEVDPLSEAMGKVVRMHAVHAIKETIG